ncbi:hypothetical protein [Thiohalorhabdus sp.]|uniref:hypothetical protein n=1 Tax=Thiohalorhabdus sp. TaxID=3094134 RepID=UPI002FC2FB7C
MTLHRRKPEWLRLYNRQNRALWRFRWKMMAHHLGKDQVDTSLAIRIHIQDTTATTEELSHG